MIVKSELEKLGFHNVIVDLGEIETSESLTPEQTEQFRLACFNRPGIDG
jgi:hypothetical protein